jgi:hypothetical protein
MIQNILRHLGSIERYGTFSLCLFCAIFAAVFVWACLQRKSHLEYMAHIPLEAESEPSENGEQAYE